VSTAKRRLHLGVSCVAEGWTDGSANIAIEREQVGLMEEGIGGFIGLSHLVTHELLHDSDDTGDHTHDYEFYANYHNATCSRAGILNQVVHKGLRRWVGFLRHYDLEIPRTVAEHIGNKPITEPEMEESFA